MIPALVAVLLVGAAAGWAGAMSATRSERSCCHPYVRGAQCVLCAAYPVDLRQLAAPAATVSADAATAVTDPADAATGA